MSKDLFHYNTVILLCQLNDVTFTRLKSFHLTFGQVKLLMQTDQQEDGTDAGPADLPEETRSEAEHFLNVV